MTATVYVGFDWREEQAWQVCKYSLEKHASVPLEIKPIGESHSWYTRSVTWEGDQRFDAIDGTPFSTDFSFARFLVPVIERNQGWVMFCDCDFLFRADVAELFALADKDKAVMCVPHQHDPDNERKMGGVIQSKYPRKNWSSLVLWNTDHRANNLVGTDRGISAEKVNTYPGVWLHYFSWLKIKEIGYLPEEWNHLVGHSQTKNPKAVHFTEGGPWFKGYEQVPYSEEWRMMRDTMLGNPPLKINVA